MSTENKNTGILAGLAEARNDSFLLKERKESVLAVALESAQQCVEDAVTIVQSETKKKVHLPHDGLKEIEEKLSGYINDYYAENSEINLHDLKLEATDYAKKEVYSLLSVLKDQRRRRNLRILVGIAAVIVLVALIYLLFVPKRVRDYALKVSSGINAAEISSVIDDRHIIIQYAPAAMIEADSVQETEMKKGTAHADGLIPETQYAYRVKGGEKAQNYQVLKYTKEASVENDLFDGSLYMAQKDKQGKTDSQNWKYVEGQTIAVNKTSAAADGAYLMILSAHKPVLLDDGDRLEVYMIASNGTCAVSTSMDGKDVVLDAYTLVIPLDSLCDQLYNLSGIWSGTKAKLIYRYGDEFIFRHSIDVRITESEVNL